MKPVRTLRCFTRYKCIQSKCKQNCCVGWKIAVDNKTIDKWREKAPYLLDYIESYKDEDGENKYKMKKKGICCIALTDEYMCEIQAKHGECMIPNLCGYFPHLYKDFGDYVYSSINLSCPAVVKSILFCNSKDDWKFVDWKPNFEKDKIFSYSSSITISYKDCELLLQKIFKLLDQKEDFDILLATFTKVCFENHELSTSAFAKNLKKDFFKCKKRIKKEYRKRKNEVSDVFFNTIKTMAAIDDSIEAINLAKQEFGIKENEKEAVDISKLGTVQTKYRKVIDNYRRNTKHQIDDMIKNYFKCRLAEYLFPAYYILYGLRSTLCYIVCELMAVKLVLICLIKSDKDLQDSDRIIHLVASIGRAFYARQSKKTYEKISDNYWFHRDTLNDYILYY